MILSKKNFAILLLTTTLCSGVSRSSSAEEPKPAIEAGRVDSPTTSRLPAELEGKVTTLKKGARAPMKGILLTRVTLVQIMKAYEKRVKLAKGLAEKANRDATARVAASEAAAKVRVEVAEAKAGACLADSLRRERVYEEALKRGAAPPSVWRSPWFIGSVGAILGSGICIGASAATGR